MVKLEYRAEKREVGQNAHSAVRKFAMEVDLKKALDKSGAAAKIVKKLKFVIIKIIIVIRSIQRRAKNSALRIWY